MMRASALVMAATKAAAAEPFPWRNDSANLAVTAAWNE